MKQMVKLLGLIKWKCFIKREIINIKQNRKSSSNLLIFIISTVLPQYNANNNKNDALLLAEPPAFNSCTFCKKLEYCKKYIYIKLKAWVSHTFMPAQLVNIQGEILLNQLSYNCIAVIPKQFLSVHPISKIRLVNVHSQLKSHVLSPLKRVK